MVYYRNLLVEKLEYDNFTLYVHCMVFYNKDKDFEDYNYDIYQKKIFKFKNIKKFQYYADEQYFSFYDEIKELKKELEELYPGENIICDPLSLSVSCHIGPHSLAIAICKKI